MLHNDNTVTFVIVINNVSLQTSQKRQCHVIFSVKTSAGDYNPGNYGIIFHSHTLGTTTGCEIMTIIAVKDTTTYVLIHKSDRLVFCDLYVLPPCFDMK